MKKIILSLFIAMAFCSNVFAQSAQAVFVMPPSGSGMVVGQATIATTGTAVQLSSVNRLLYNGMIITAAPGNNSSCATIGVSAVNNTVNGTGNGMIICPGASVSVGSGIYPLSVYVNGTAGDIFSYIGN